MSKKKPKKGLVDLVWVDPKTLAKNPLNWKIHPKSQMTGVMAAIQSLGWVKPVIYNLTTQRLLDGHGRVTEAVNKGIKAVPVNRGYWTKEEEIQILKTLDPLGGMYRIDSEKFESLNALSKQNKEFLENATQETREHLKKLDIQLSSIPRRIKDGTLTNIPLPLANAKKVKVEEDDEDTSYSVESGVDSTDEEESPIETTLAEDTIFTSDNVWGLPTWITDKLATPDMVPDKTYSRVPESVSDKSYYCFSARPFPLRDELQTSGGVLGFFCEDYRFDGCYSNAAEFTSWILEEDWSCVLAPDFSTYADWPFSMQLWNLYRSRWAARYWQSLDVYVMPILQSVIFDDGRETIDVALETMPHPCPVFAVQCRTLKQQGGDFKSFGRWLASCIKELKAERVVIYGGGEHQSKFLGYLPKETRTLKYSLLQSYMMERKEIIRKKDRERKRKG